jgi:hypothetical protein
MAAAEILISITGMGDPESGDSDAWARLLFPTGVLIDQGDRKILRVGTRDIHLLEVLYEEYNEAIRAKIESLGQILPGNTPEEAKATIEDYAFDVVENVLLDGALDASQVAFVETYNEAVQRARELVGQTGNVRTARIGVVSHSLGTLIAYEGVSRAFDTAMITSIVDVNIVMCAPMLAPIHHVLQALGKQDRYLTRNASRKPYKRSAAGRWYSIVKHCLAIYDTRDPFHLIHDDEFYRNTPDNDLVEEMRTYTSSTPLTRFWEGHSMEGSYLANNRDAIAEWLFR